ncbi:MAG: CbiX/SirB N-terminal domain-containing protein [Burkholderiales bacterium]|nr:CbiX/SirB N-terminal domain-containing protein [Burkholderiales bacterium]
MTKTGLILFAHGARDPRWVEPFERLKLKVGAARPDVQVALAFLDIMAPNLPTAADALVTGGCQALRIIPVFLGQGGHVRDDIPALIAAIAARHPAVAVEVLCAVGEDDAVLQRIAEVSVAGL